MELKDTLKPVYLGDKTLKFADIDETLQKVADQIPIVDTDRIYLWELQTQERVFILFMIIGILLFFFTLLL